MVLPSAERAASTFVRTGGQRLRTAAQYGGPVECETGAIWDEGYLAYDFGDHPLNPVRLDLTFEPSTPPWGFGEGMEDETWADVHYEHPGRFTGRGPFATSRFHPI